MNRLVKVNNNVSVNPVDFFDTMFDEMLGNFVSPGFRRFSSSMNCLQSDYFTENGEMIINVDVAGSTKEDVDVQYHKDQNTLVVKVGKQYEKKETKPTFYLRERTISERTRSFKLPDNIDVSTITADVHNGLLTVRAKVGEIEKSPAVIPIKVNS